jgi:hypothetical protein
MNRAIEAYRSVTAAEEFRTLERMRASARHNKAGGLLSRHCNGGFKSPKIQHISKQQRIRNVV